MTANNNKHIIVNEMMSMRHLFFSYYYTFYQDVRFWLRLMSRLHMPYYIDN